MSVKFIQLSFCNFVSVVGVQSSESAQGRKGVLEVLVGLVEVGLLARALVGESGCLGFTAVAVGMQAVGMVHSEGMGAVPNTGTVAVDAKEITGVGKATLNGGMTSGERLGGGEERVLARGINGPVAGWMVMLVWAGTAGGDMRGGPS